MTVNLISVTSQTCYKKCKDCVPNDDQLAEGFASYYPISGNSDECQANGEKYSQNYHTNC